MPRRLSSSFQTWTARIAAIGGIVLAVFWFPRFPLPASNAFKVLFVLWLLGFLYGCIRTFGFKTVELDGNDLLISNFGEPIRVPLDTISAVKGGLGGKNPIKLEFRIATDFGESIKFLPMPRSTWPWQRHPLVEELEGLCRLGDRPL
jgi:hypothetical protein